MRIVTYEDKYVLSLSRMLYDYFKEMHPTTFKGNLVVAENMITYSLRENKAIYLLLNDINLPVGFMICYLNDQYGMVNQYMTVEYQYLKPNYRNGTAIAHQFDMVGRICEDYGCGTVNTTYTSSKNIHNLSKLGVHTIAVVTFLSEEEVKEKHKKFKLRIDR